MAKNKTIPKIKSQDTNKISKGTIKNNKPSHIKFNYSFIANNKQFSYENKHFTDDHKLAFLSRMMELSSKDFIEIMAYPKKIGLEFIDRKSFKRKIEYNSKFEDVEYRRQEIDNKYAVFRLYPNNNPKPSRIIGKLINNVFYVMYIDLDHDIYNG